MGGDPRLAEFFELFGREKFFEAHEVLESLWRETTGPERDFYHGLIQLAAARVHVQRKNPAGAEELYRRASRYLAKYPDVYGGVEIGPIKEAVRKKIGKG